MGKYIFMFRATGYYIPIDELSDEEREIITMYDIFNKKEYRYSDYEELHKFELYFNTYGSTKFYFIAENDIKILVDQKIGEPKYHYFKNEEFAIQIGDYGMHNDDVNIEFTNVSRNDSIRLNNIIRDKSIYGEFIISIFN